MDLLEVITLKAKWAISEKIQTGVCLLVELSIMRLREDIFFLGKKRLNFYICHFMDILSEENKAPKNYIIF